MPCTIAKWIRRLIVITNGLLFAVNVEASVGLELVDQGETACLLTGLSVDCFDHFGDKNNPFFRFDFSEVHVARVRNLTLYSPFLCAIADGRMKCPASFVKKKSLYTNKNPENYFRDFHDVLKIAVGRAGICVIDAKLGLRCIDSYNLILPEYQKYRSEDDRSYIEHGFPSQQVSDVVVSDSQACALKKDGRVTCWGQAGNATISLYKSAVRIHLHNKLSCAELIDGSMDCWGLFSALNYRLKELSSRRSPSSYVRYVTTEELICYSQDSGPFECLKGREEDGHFVEYGGFSTENYSKHLDSYPEADFITSNDDEICLVDTKTNTIDIDSGRYKFLFNIPLFRFTNPDLGTSFEIVASKLYPNRASFLLAAVQLARSIDEQSKIENLDIKRAERNRAFVWHAVAIFLNEIQTTYVSNQVLPNLNAQMKDYDKKNNLPLGVQSYERSGVIKKAALRLAASALAAAKQSIVDPQSRTQGEALYTALGFAVAGDENDDLAGLVLAWQESTGIMQDLAANSDTRAFASVMASMMGFVLQN